MMSPASLAHLLQDTAMTSQIHSVDVWHNGVPIIITTLPAAYAYDPTRSEWTELASYSALRGVESSRRSRVAHQQGPLSHIESELLELSASLPVPSDSDKPEWFDIASELSLLECRMRASVLMDSKDEYKYWAVRYARLLGEEDFRGRAEELIKELLGPIYW
jgi:protein HIRA/HIR1